MTFAFIDDFGLFKLIPLEGTPEELLDEEGRQTREAFTALGFGVHKEGFARGLEKGLGVTIPAVRPYVVRIARGAATLKRGATRHVLRKKTEYPARLEKLMGHWSWELQLARSGYSIPHTIYAFIHRPPRSSGPVVLWGSVRAELWTLLVLSPFFKACLELPWWLTANAGDSSMAAFGIVETQASIEELREEG